MSYTHLYKILVPNAPPHRRTEKDAPPSPQTGARMRAESLLRTAALPGLQQPRLVSSYAGSLDRILFTFPAYAVNDAALASAYRSLIAALRPGTRFIVLHHKPDKATVESWFSAANHPPTNLTLIALPDYVGFTDWAEDAYVALSDAADSSTYLMEPWEFSRAADALIAESVQDYSDITASQAPLVFQGGNCLIGSDFWLLGKDYFADSVALVQADSPLTVPPDVKPEAFVRQLFANYVDSGRRLITPGTKRAIPIAPFYGTVENGAYFLDMAVDGAGTFQPIFHIDMFITLIGVNASGSFDVLVGSPAMADTLLGTNSPYALNPVYDDFAKQLAAEGFTVHRNPLVHRPTLGESFTIKELRDHGQQPGNETLLDALKRLTTAGATDNSSVTVRTWHHITWNNCLVENSTVVGKHVYLPTFGHGSNADLQPLDAHMQALWEQLGFSVHLLGDFNAFASRQGVVHCIKKYLNRGE
ncbi:MAG: hypothetical protein BWK73_12955 [Thiothrix lacustris]|uniref:Agmatine deiminase n=1 Tax=Thiothrix lacustris TaxID=525917 RepID=A0A1Y1QTU6_9GAMM|nr:MAG: hypothetical protein BWK73_12955 [Thiothrix lacustris]